MSFFILQGILACCNPVPPLVKQHLQNIHMIILKVIYTSDFIEKKLFSVL